MNNKLIALLIFVSGVAYAQEGADTKKLKFDELVYRIGIHASPTTGTGFSFKVTSKDKHQFQLVSLPIYSSANTSMNGSLNYYFKFVNSRVFDVMAFTGVTYDYTSDPSIRPSSIFSEMFPEFSIPKSESSYQLNYSIGVGFEVGQTEYKKLGLFLGYGMYDMLDDFSTYPTIGFSLELGLL